MHIRPFERENIAIATPFPWMFHRWCTHATFVAEMNFVSELIAEVNFVSKTVAEVDFQSQKRPKNFASAAVISSFS